MAENLMNLELPSRVLDLSTPRVMGILNVTPDSFSDGGRHVDINAAVAAARQMLDEGAAIIDVGGESTRPGATPVDEAEELQRVIPLIERLVGETGCLVSIDTMKPAVMRAACRAGAAIINDVNALQAEGAVETAAAAGVGVCLMHMQGTPQTMQQAPTYGDIIDDVRRFLEHRISVCVAAGIQKNRLLIDPGFGFGKMLEHNLELMARLAEFQVMGVSLLVGVSRKGMLGQLTGRPVEQRISAGVAAAAIAVANGARIIRTHDVAATVDAVHVAFAVLKAAQGRPAAS